MSAVSAENGEVSAATRRILIAEDDQDLLTTYKMWLSEHDNFEVLSATDGCEAMDVLPDEVDVFICDRRMPNLSGPEVIDRLDAENHDISVIVVSAYEPDAALDETDVDRYINKPVTRGDLADAITDVLGG